MRKKHAEVLTFQKEKKEFSDYVKQIPNFPKQLKQVIN